MDGEHIPLTATLRRKDLKVAKDLSPAVIAGQGVSKISERLGFQNLLNLVHDGLTQGQAGDD